MARARPVLPIDLPALVAYRGKVYPNEARPRERIGAGEVTPNPIETALDQWLSFATRRNAWISAHRQRLLGLVSARRRGGRRAWEIDCLIDTTPGHNAVPGLIDCAVQAGGRAGAEKIFLRLNVNSPLLPVVINAGFSAYDSERLYVGSALALAGAEAPVRPFSQPDQYPAYRLANCTAPERVRWAEAATFGEWQAAQERIWTKAGAQLVMDAEGGLSAHVKAARLPHGVAVDVTADRAGLDVLQGLMHAAVRAVGPVTGPVMVLVHDSDFALATRLADLGFEPRDEFVSLLCRTARPAKLPRLVPATIPKGAVIT
jgi:hypothetical protein